MSQLLRYPRVLLLAAIMVLPTAAVNAGHISINDVDEATPSSSFDTLPTLPAQPAVASSAEIFATDLTVLADESESQNQMNLSPVGMMVATSTISEIPEPGTVILLGLGALGVLLAGRRRLKQ